MDYIPSAKYVWTIYRAQSLRTCYCIEVSKLEVKVDGEDNLGSYIIIYIHAFILYFHYEELNT